MIEQTALPSLTLTTACRPVFEFLTNFVRQVKHGTAPAPDKVRYEALSALRDAEDRVRDETASERAWEDRIKAMLIYFLDYKMINTQWEGSNYWFDNLFEIDSTLLNHAQALGGEDFFNDCDELQREFEVADRRDRRDKHELAEQLNLYFVCLRLGFKGQFDDRPQELADYTRRLFTRLPAYAVTRAGKMFPDTYQHKQDLKVNYNLGVGLTVVLTVFLLVSGLALIAFRYAWDDRIDKIKSVSQDWVEHAQHENSQESPPDDAPSE